MQKEFDYDNFNWSEHFKLDPNVPSALVWNRETWSLGGNRLQSWVGKPAGAIGSCKNGVNKRWTVFLKVNGKSLHFAAHRVIACLNGMKVNGLVIDHINGISADNRIENLRVTTQAVNSRNSRQQNNCPYGIQGVSYYEDKLDNLYFNARMNLTIDGKPVRVQKNFPVKKLGLMPAFKLAVQARYDMIAALNSDGYEYSDRHVNPSSVEHGTFLKEVEEFCNNAQTRQKELIELSKPVINKKGR